jgi:peptidoglycan hydrolase-like protein with peptidoglycan-binding domain
VAYLVMYDSIDPAQIPADAVAAAGYVNGSWPDYDTIRARFPNANVLSVAVTSDANADCLDIETGDATPADAAGWFERQKAAGVTRPCLYADASTMASDVVPILEASGIDRASVRLWSAHYTYEAHICGPGSCGAVSIDMDGTQFTDAAAGAAGDLDESLLLTSFFDGQPAPAPAPVPSPVPAWQETLMNTLPTLQLGAQDQAGQVEFVHRAQALTAVIGAITGLPSAKGLKLDGGFGGKTQAAILAVQTHFGITADGIIGEQTWGVLVTGAAA